MMMMILPKYYDDYDDHIDDDVDDNNPAKV